MALAREGALGLSPPGLIAIWSGGGADFARAITACAVAIALGFGALIPGRSGAARLALAGSATGWRSAPDPAR